ncbi:hypothetical protein RRV45_10665 [Bacillus sp. DTU_2020_1000418_1_SI_GHA_SEK_038]|nr:hypothetical protein [Bacillus sp. DTU_2020_1000418_1_SI_GHA_SEK_038]WNS77417.1 hypothetical protein RRV45_10665 [Bacillus sp. DTU_2020_1000418_1_SI_GHA_SEK_038]
MKNKNEESSKMSYESDGKMGKNNNQQEQGKRKVNADFFNSTQNSE